MMPDQAAELRNLVRRATRGAASGPTPMLLAVVGGKGGVGATTLAVNLALAASELGSRVVLADMNLCRADVAPLCGMSEQASIADVLTARRDVHEALQPGPGGLQVLPGAWAPSEPTHLTEASIERLLVQLRNLGRHAELVMLDLGSGGHELHRHLWTAADMVLLVTTADDLAVMDAYATIKTAGAECTSTIFVVVNQIDQTGQGEDVFTRLAQSCQRFLTRHVEYAGSVPYDEAAAQAAAARVPLWLSAPDSRAATAIDHIAHVLQPHLEHKVESLGGKTKSPRASCR